MRPRARGFLFLHARFASGSDACDRRSAINRNSLVPHQMAHPCLRGAVNGGSLLPHDLIEGLLDFFVVYSLATTQTTQLGHLQVLRIHGHHLVDWLHAVELLVKDALQEVMSPLLQESLLCHDASYEAESLVIRPLI